MDDMNLFQIFGEIDAEIVQKANDDLNFWQNSQKGVSVRPAASRRSSRRAVIASVCGIAAVFGVFVLLNVLKGGFFTDHITPYAPASSDLAASLGSSSDDISQTTSSQSSSGISGDSESISLPGDISEPSGEFIKNEKVDEFIREIELSGRGRPYVGSTRHFEKMFVDFDGTEIYLPIQNTDFLYQHPYA